MHSKRLVATNAPTELGTSGVYALTLTATETNATTLAIIPATTTEGVFLPLLTAEPVENVDLTGLATTANIANLQTHGDSAWSTADVSGLSTLTTADIPTPPSASSIATSVWNKDLASYTLTNTCAGTIINEIFDDMLRDSDKASWASSIATQVWLTNTPGMNNPPVNSASAMLQAIPTTSTIPSTTEEIASAVWSSGSRTLTDTDLSGLSTPTAQVVGLLGRWTVSGTPFRRFRPTPTRTSTTSSTTRTTAFTQCLPSARLHT